MQKKVNAISAVVVTVLSLVVVFYEVTHFEMMNVPIIKCQPMAYVVVAWFTSLEFFLYSLDLNKLLRIKV